MKHLDKCCSDNPDVCKGECMCHHTKLETGWDEKKAVQECAEAIVRLIYYGSSLHRNDIIPDIEKLLQTARTRGKDEGYQDCWQHFKDMDAFQLGARKERERIVEMLKIEAIQEGKSYPQKGT